MSHRVVFGILAEVKRALAAQGWQINTAFIGRRWWSAIHDDSGHTAAPSRTSSFWLSQIDDAVTSA
jgi:hypothetical protein